MAPNPEAPTTRYYLNALNRRDGQLPAPKRGTWNENSDFLNLYSQSVDLKVQLESSELAHSVPSVFQRPIQFYRALNDPGNPLHDVMLNEWRGLMAVIGLSSWLELNVTVSQFKVPSANPDAISSVGQTGNGDLHFSAMVRNQLPLRTVANAVPGRPETRVSDWEQWWMIRCSGVSLGATSPWSLLYTAYTSTRAKVPMSIPWQRGGALIDPIQHYDPKLDRNPVELAILYAWVTAMLDRRDFWHMGQAMGVYEILVAKTLEAWQKDLQRYGRVHFEVQPHESELFPEEPLRNILWKPVPGDLVESDVLLGSRKRGGTPVIVFSESLPSDTRIYGSVFAGRVDVTTLKAEGSSFVSRDGVLVTCPYIVPEKLFFPPKLVKLELSEHAVQRGKGDVSLPLSPRFFEYFDHEELSILSLAYVPGSTRATLRIPLQQRQPLEVHHNYPDDHIIKLQTGPPAFALWPDRYDKSWHEGFAAYAAPAKLGDDLRVQPIFLDGTTDINTARIDPDQKDVRIWSCNQRPAIGFALSHAGEDGTLRAAGLVLQRELRRPMSLDSTRTWRIGVDFGTSSTTVMLQQREGSRPEEMQFDGHTIFLSKESSNGATSISNSLYPSTSTKSPFRTLLYEPGATKFGTQTTPYTLRFTASSVPDLFDQPVPNLKWGDPKDQGDPLTAYLQALVRYIIWEARVNGIKNVAFFWSYPLSLPRGPLGAMRNFWGNVAIKYADVGKDSQSADPQRGMTIAPPVSISESEAVCRAFAAGEGGDHGANVAAGMLTIAIDIGGGSTDIAFWSEGRMLDQFSFKVAGNDILDRRYLNEDALASVFEICYGAKMTSPDSLRAIKARPEIYLNGALTEAKKDGAVFTGRNPRLHPLAMGIYEGRTGSTPWINFRSMIYLFFSGLSYYLGVHSRSIGVKQPRIDIYFGGRGSSLLTWLSANPYDTLPALKHSFLLGLGRQADESLVVAFPRQNVEPEFKGLAITDDVNYPALKTEVAKGLLAPPLREIPKQQPCVVGEVGWTREGKKVDWHTRVEPQELGQLEPPDNFDSTTIGEFSFEVLVTDRGKYLESLNLDRALLKTLVPEGSSIQGLIRAQESSDTYVPQPVFAYELKTLMQQYAQEVEKVQAGVKP